MTEKCRVCREILEESWVYCEYCGKKTKSETNTNSNKEETVKIEIMKKTKQEQLKKHQLIKQSHKMERIPVTVTLLSKEKQEIDPKTTLFNARLKARELARETPTLDEPISTLGPLKSNKSIHNVADAHTEKMISFLEEYNRSENLKSTQQTTTVQSKIGDAKIKKQQKHKGKSKSNNNDADFFRNDLEVKHSQNFNVVSTKSESYLDNVPSLLDIFDDPSLLPPRDECQKNIQQHEEVGDGVNEARVGTQLQAKISDLNDDNQEPEPEVLFWGQVTDSEHPVEEEVQQAEPIEDVSSLQKAVREMKLFKGDFWGDQHGSDADDVGKCEEQRKLEQDEINALICNDEDDNEEGEAVTKTDDYDEWDEDSVVSFHRSDGMDMAEVFEQLKVDLTSFNTESGRRHIAKLYRRSMKHMNVAIERGTIVFSRDPISQSCPVSLYKRLDRKLQHVIDEAELSVRAIDELYRLCHSNAKHRRLDVVARLEAEHKRAAQVRHKYSVKYAAVTNKENIDIYTLEGAQNRIREKAEKELDLIRVKVNDLLKEETDLIMKIKSEERSLELTVVMYSTKHLRLIEQTKVTHQSVVSATRWLAVRVIQRNVRFHILRGNEFKLAHVGTPWFRKLVRQQAEMLRQQQLASSPEPTGRRNRK